MRTLSISVEEARSFANDNESTPAEMQGYIDAAEAYVKDGVGANVDFADPRAALLVKMLVCEFDDHRCVSAKETGAVSWAARSLLFQLRVALAGTEAADG